ncbi:YncE family protein [Mycobacterium sp. RTGN5]|uniref:YncE family protein n=1 Tax=Mycobacterium sp. RTGN5 TaxID=3016522 RepID=UPI0029C9996D|nr:beta-propeller fold lactonase family protein [Mycobacterium sp. RTGN5]
MFGLTAPTAPTNPVGAFVWGLLRQIESGQGLIPVAGTPTIGTPDSVTGVVTGTLGFTQPRGLPLTYTVTGMSTGGVVTVDSVGGFIYTPNQAPQADAVTNTDTFTVTASDGLAGTNQTVTVAVNLGAISGPVTRGAYGVAVSPDGLVLYVTNGWDSAIQAFNTANNDYLGGFSVHHHPTGLAFSPDGFAVFVTDNVVNTVSYVVNAEQWLVPISGGCCGYPPPEIPVGSAPTGVAVSPNGSSAVYTVYVANAASNTVSVITTATDANYGLTGTVTATIPVGSAPTGVAVSPNGNTVYVANGGGTVSVINTATNTVTTSIPVVDGANGVAVSPNGNTVYVANGGNAVSVINTATNTVTANIPVGVKPEWIAVSPDGTHVYVANSGSNTVSVIDTATNTVTANIPVGVKPEGIAVSPDGTHVYVANSGSDTVSVIIV